jgi:cell division protein ZapA
MRQTVEVEVFGQALAVASDDGEAHLRRVAAEVDQRMRAAAAATRSASSLAVAVVTALNIASEYQKLKTEHARLQEAIDRLAARLTKPMAG